MAAQAASPAPPAKQRLSRTIEVGWDGPTSVPEMRNKDPISLCGMCRTSVLKGIY